MNWYQQKEGKSDGAHTHTHRERMKKKRRKGNQKFDEFRTFSILTIAASSMAQSLAVYFIFSLVRSRHLLTQSCLCLSVPFARHVARHSMCCAIKKKQITMFERFNIA